MVALTALFPVPASSENATNFSILVARVSGATVRLDANITTACYSLSGRLDDHSALVLIHQGLVRVNS